MIWFLLRSTSKGLYYVAEFMLGWKYLSLECEPAVRQVRTTRQAREMATATGSRWRFGFPKLWDVERMEIFYNPTGWSFESLVYIKKSNHKTRFPSLTEMVALIWLQVAKAQGLKREKKEKTWRLSYLFCFRFAEFGEKGEYLNRWQGFHVALLTGCLSFGTMDVRER